MAGAPYIAVLGAGGLIGHAVAAALQARGFCVYGYGRRFTPAQRAALDGAVRQLTLLSLSPDGLAHLLDDADIVINCIGVLQGGQSDAVHRAFAERVARVCAAAPQKLLIHFSIPGEEMDDRTPFSRTKRQGEHVIAASGAPFVILRPGLSSPRRPMAAVR